MIEGYRKVRNTLGKAAAASRRLRWIIGNSGVALVLGFMLFVPSPVGATTDAELATNARLLTSVRSEDAIGVQRALHDGAAVNSRTRLGESGLLLALKKNRADIAQALLAAGADVNLPAINGVTPLMAAAYGAHNRGFKALRARGADPAGAAPRTPLTRPATAGSSCGCSLHSREPTANRRGKGARCCFSLCGGRRAAMKWISSKLNRRSAARAIARCPL